MFEPDWKELGIKDKSRAGIFLRNYLFSSYADYVGIKRAESAVLNKKAFPEYFSTLKDFNNTINDWLAFKTFQG